MGSARRIVSTVNRVLMASGLELMTCPEYMEYASGQSAKKIKTMKIEKIRFEICRDILTKELNSPELTKSNDQMTAIRLVQLLQVATVNPDRFIPALHKIADVFSQIPFAEYHRKENEMYMAMRSETPSLAPAHFKGAA